MSNINFKLLHLAQETESDSDPSYLLNEGANPNFRDNENHKWTALHYAVFLNKENFALRLLQHPQTNALLLDSDGFSALYWASKKSTPQIILALLSKGCDPNERDMHGMTALFAAVASNKTENVKALISHPSINVNQVNQFGGSALHHTAFAADNVQIADMLVCCGANLWLIDYEDQYPLHVAKRRKREKLFKYFTSKMLLEKPNWKCPINFLDHGWDSETEETTTETEETEEKSTQFTQIIPQQSVTQNVNMNNDKSNGSTDSGFSRQSSDNGSDNDKSPKQGRYNSEPLTRVKKQKRNRKPLSQSPQPKHRQYNNSYKNVNMKVTSHEQKMKQLQKNKFKMALKIEQSKLNDEARDLLQEQQYYFQYEQQVFYEANQQQFSTFRRDIDSLKHEISRLKHENMKLIQQNTELQHKNIKLNIALAYQHPHQHQHTYIKDKMMMKGKNKYTKEFKRWFKKEIGLMEYFPCFINNGFDDLKTIRHITKEQTLKQLGIDKMGHRFQILHAIDAYRKSSAQKNEDAIAQPAFENCVSSPINKSIINNIDINDMDEGGGLHTRDYNY